MGIKTLLRTLPLLVLTAGALVGCAPTNGNTPTPQAPSEATQSARDAIAELRTTYSAGRYGDVIREVSRSNTLAQAPMDIHLEAMKLQAFSYCLTKHRVLCEDQFRRMLVVDPNFELASTERGHPQWQPAFDAARRR